MIKRISLLLLSALYLAGAVAILAGCNTVQGAGQDIQQGGKAISNEAVEQKN